MNQLNKLNINKHNIYYFNNILLFCLFKSKINTLYFQNIKNYSFNNKFNNKMINIENTIEEYVAQVDEHDNVINKITRKQLRKDNLIHRSNSIFIFNPRTNKYAIQIRSLKKEYCPGYYDLVTGGIIGYNEDLNKAVLRELNEEMGVNLSDCSNELNKLKYITKIFYNSDYTRLWTYVYFLEYDGEFKFNDGEVTGVVYWSKDEIIEKIKSNEKICPDTVHVFKELINQNLI